MGKTPLVLTDVLPGTHWIRLDRPGEPPEVKKVLVRSKRTILVEFDEGEGSAEPTAGEGLAASIAKNEIDKAALKQLAKAAKRAKADFVMFGGDLAQLGSKPELDHGAELLSALKYKTYMVMGEHDYYLDLGEYW